MNVELPNGVILEGVPDDATKEDIQNKAVMAGLATDDDFAGAFHRGVIGAGAGLTRAYQGAKQVAMHGAEALGLMDEGSVDSYTEEVNKERQEFDESGVGKTTAAKVGVAIGESAPTMAIPGGVGGKIGKKILTGAMSNAAAEALRYSEDPDMWSGERVRNIAGGALIGGAMPAVVDGIAAGSRFVRNTVDEITPSGARRQVKGNVGVEDIQGNVKDAADDLGVFVTPAEASGRADLHGMEHALTIDRVDDFSKKIAGRLEHRTQKLSQTLEDTIESVARKDPASAQKIADGYAKLNALNLSRRFVTHVEGDEILAKAWNKMHRSADYAGDLKRLPDNSAGQLDVFKQFLYERGQQLKKKGRYKHAKHLDDFRTRMVKDLDAVVPEYGEARALSQLNIVNRTMQDAIKKGKNLTRRTEDGSYTTSAVDFFRKMMKSEQDYEDLMRAMSAVPESQRKLTQVREILAATEKSGIEKVFHGAPNKSGLRGTSGFGKAGALTISGFDALRGLNTDHVIEFITNPSYSADLLQSVDPGLIKRNLPLALDFFSKSMARVGAGAATPEAKPQP